MNDIYDLLIKIGIPADELKQNQGVMGDKLVFSLENLIGRKNMQEFDTKVKNLIPDVLKNNSNAGSFGRWLNELLGG